MGNEAPARKCPAPYCSTAPRPGQLSCSTHWWQLPAKLRSKIYSTRDRSPLDPTRRRYLTEANQFWKANPSH